MGYVIMNDALKDPQMNRYTKLFLWIIGGVGTLLVLLLLLILLAPTLVNLAPIRRTILASISRHVGGEVHSQRIDLAFFPRFRLTLQQGNVSIAGSIQGRFTSLTGYPKIASFFSGNVGIAELHVDTLDATIQLTDEIAEQGPDLESLSFGVIKASVLGVVSLIASKTPNLVVTVEKGRINFLEKDKAVFHFQDIQSRIVFPPDRLTVDIACTSNLWEKLSMEASVSPEDGKGDGWIHLTQFRPHVLVGYFFPSSVQRIDDSQVNLSLCFKTHDFNIVQAEVESVISSLSLHDKNEEITGHVLGKWVLDESGESITGNMRLESAIFTWGDTHLTLEGDMDLSAEGILMDMNLVADGFDWDTIEKLHEPTYTKKNVKQDEASWGLPLQGVLRVKLGHLKYGTNRWSPFHAIVTFGRDRINVEVAEANLCGIATPGNFIISSQSLRLDVKTIARKEALDTALTCLWGQEGLMTGTFDLAGEFGGEGKNHDLVKALEGNAEFTAYDGRIYRLGLLAKLFAVLNITEIFTGELPDLVRQGFGYKSIKGTAHLHGGKLMLEKGIIDGASMTIACEGDMDFIDRKLNLTILVAPFKTVDRIIKYTPLIGDILGGNLISIPIKVTGDMADPSVTPLPPSAVGSGLLGIMKRTLQLPVNIVQPLLPKKKE